MRTSSGHLRRGGHGMRLSIFLAAVVTASLAAEVPRLDLSRFMRFDEIEPMLRAFATAHPERTTLRSMGSSREGRDLWVLEICDPATGAASDKAAMYIDANAHGNEIQGTEICLYTIHTLLQPEEPRRQQVARLLERCVFLIAPCVNPDGRAHFLGQPNSLHSQRNNLRPFDSDGDGRADEDGGDDLDGDGEILRMRRQIAGGGMEPMAGEPRLLVNAGAGQRGDWQDLGPEGIDNDGDGTGGEDPAGGVDLNRNYPTHWAPESVQPGAGPYPLSEPETRAVAAYLLSWPNLAAVQSYHNHGGMILRPPGVAPDDVVGMPAADLAVYDELGRRGEEILPGYRYVNAYYGLEYAVHGGFLDWCYLGRGIIAFTNELWSFPGDDSDGDGIITEAEQLAWNDRVLAGAAFRDWRPFEHPTYGAIEIGGWRKLRSLRVPPSSEMLGMCERNCRFTFLHAEATPRIVISDIRVTSHSDRLHWVDVTVTNTGLIPTATQMGHELGLAYDDLLTIEGRHTTALASGVLPSPSGPATLRPGTPAEVELGNIRGKGSVTARFLVEAWKSGTITATSQKGGVARQDFSYKDR